MRQTPEAMRETNNVAIVDYGTGNLFSVAQACAIVGIRAVITDDAETVRASSAVIVPGVGAFGEAMASLRARGLVTALEEVVGSGRPLFGICLGMQLFMKTSLEFGFHQGLGFIDGKVLPLEVGMSSVDRIPHIGWNVVKKTPAGAASEVLADLPLSTQMYFVHSFYVEAPDSIVMANTSYGGLTFCSAILDRNIFACQFHPERSSREGLKMYECFARLVI